MGFRESNFTCPGFTHSGHVKAYAHDDKPQKSQILDNDASDSNEHDLPGENGDHPQPHSREASLDDGGHIGSRPSSPRLELKSVKPQSIRQRTAQACDRCRERKTKCSGNRPICLRCTNRGLICEYSIRESRIRTPMRTRTQFPITLPDPLQVNYHDVIRPTPAHHSRLGNCRKQAFALSTGAFPTSNAPQPPLPSYSATPFGNNMRLGVPCQSVLDLDICCSSDGCITVPNDHGAINDWGPRSNSSRPHSQPAHARSGDYSRPAAAANTLFNMASGSIQEESDVSYGYDLIYKNIMAGQTPMLSIHANGPGSRTASLGSSGRLHMSDASYHGNDIARLSASSSSMPLSPNRQNHRSRSTSPISPEQNSSQEQHIQRYPKDVPMDFHLPMYRSNPTSGGYSDWTNSSNMIPPEPTEPTYILSAHHNEALNRSPSEGAEFYSLYGHHNGESSASTPSSASNLSGTSSQGSASLMYPAPIMPIGPGAHGTLLLDNGSHEAHDAFQQHPADYGMLMHPGQDPSVGADLAELHHTAHSVPPVSETGYRFQGYHFFK